jgi:hypothetical protein
MFRRSVRAPALVAALLASGPASAQDQGPEGIEVDAEIVLAVDASRSMDLAEFAVQRDGYTQALRHPDLIRAISAGRRGRVAISYFEWSGQAEDGGWIPWRIIETPEDAASLADEIDVMQVRRSRGTSISRALSFATVLLEDDAVLGDRRVIDVSGDGANNVGPPVTAARDQAVMRGITINGLPVMTSPNGLGSFAELDRYYEDCVIGGIGAFMLVAGTAEQLEHTIRRKLILEISGIEPDPRIVPADFEPIDCLIGEKQYRRRGIYFR